MPETQPISDVLEGTTAAARVAVTEIIVAIREDLEMLELEVNRQVLATTAAAVSRRMQSHCQLIQVVGEMIGNREHPAGHITTCALWGGLSEATAEIGRLCLLLAAALDTVQDQAAG